mmetsp:Transcript_36369/g.88086  ORF Transcript_36369/g.88086 Transcript_36369/m.88086 type:complete len:129 (+) Transcript_36369:304-690(+)
MLTAPTPPAFTIMSPLTASTGASTESDPTPPTKKRKSNDSFATRLNSTQKQKINKNNKRIYMNKSLAFKEATRRVTRDWEKDPNVPFTSPKRVRAKLLKQSIRSTVSYLATAQSAERSTISQSQWRWA